MNPTTPAQTKNKLPTASGQSSTLSGGGKQNTKKKNMFASLLTELKRASRYESEHESEREGRDCIVVTIVPQKTTGDL
jgi:hypothetical protein